MALKIRTIEKVQMYDSGFEYEIGSNGKVKCPVCGNYVFAEPDDWDLCPICGMENGEPVLMNIIGGSRGKTLRQALQEYKNKTTED